MKQFPFLVMMLVGLIMSCQTIQQTEKQAITRIFLENKNTFRGINLGDSLARIKKMEKIPPKHEDWLGLVYNYEVEKNCVMEVEYYADNVLTGEKTNRLKGIVANLTLKDEIATADLYEGIQTHLTQQYGEATGNFGNFYWEDAYHNLEIALKLHANKKGITLNFLERKS